jgi:hypothetical protein
MQLSLTATPLEIFLVQELQQRRPFEAITSKTQTFVRWKMINARNT